MMKISHACRWLCFAVWVLTWNITQARPSLNLLKRDLAEFEASFVDGLAYKLPNNTIKLIGYKKIKIPKPDLGEFEDHYIKNHAEWMAIDSAYYDHGAATLRVYFPVEAALIEHDGEITEANHLGELDKEELTGDCAVLGRKQTDHVTGVEGNIIKDGIIYLADRNRPHHRFGKVFVYDFGDKVLHDHNHTKRATFCMGNHGRGINCSYRYGIHEGRCPRRNDVCMDYNGRWTNCQKGGGPRYKNFPGSDCFVAISAGHCWNEIM